MRIAGCLIVKDAETILGRCLRSLSGVVDEIVVYDTGSSDATVRLAREYGATVVEGYWDEDFARARNAALESVTAEWVLSIDADEWVEADLDLLPQLRATLADGPPVLALERVDVAAAGRTRFATPRLFRRAGAFWTGRVHERVEVDGATPVTCDRQVLRVVHDGYLDPAVAATKALRNAAISESEIAGLHDEPSVSADRRAELWLDLGRSRVAAELPELAIEAFEQARTLAPSSQSAVRATDHLARTCLATGRLDRVDALVAELREAGADERYCRWLLAQARGLDGQGSEAVELLIGVDELIDPAGHHYDIGQVVEFRALARALAGDPDRALRELLVAMVGHGRVDGRGALVREWWGTRSLGELVSAIRVSGGPFAADTERELLAH